MTEENKYAEIWNTLSKIDVSKHVEKKNGLSYLSWAWAWGVLMDKYPDAQYDFNELEVHADATVTVHCVVFIKNCRRTMWLPVMDHRNNAIKNPDLQSLEKIVFHQYSCPFLFDAQLGFGTCLQSKFLYVLHLWMTSSNTESISPSPSIHAPVRG